MLAWGSAKLHGRGSKSGPRKGSKEVRECLVNIATEAHSRLRECSAQAISNIAWALATVDVLEHEGALLFLVEAASQATTALHTFSPQAVSNLWWAVVRLGHRSATMRGVANVVPAFMAAAAREASKRMSHFSWQDASGVVVALAKGRFRSADALHFASILVSRAAQQHSELSTQAMLNIALSACRLGVPVESLRILVAAIRCHTSRMNFLDLRQWAEVQQKCPDT